MNRQLMKRELFTTLGELRKILANYPDDTPIALAGAITSYTHFNENGEICLDCEDLRITNDDGYYENEGGYIDYSYDGIAGSIDRNFSIESYLNDEVFEVAIIESLDYKDFDINDPIDKILFDTKKASVSEWLKSKEDNPNQDH